MPTSTPPRALAVTIFAATIGVGAFLLFQVQFILGKQILPWFGGVPAVWTTCMLFFQVLLLLGYGYAHLLSSRLTPPRQRNVHLGVLVLAAALLLVHVAGWPSPLTPSDAWKPTADDVPAVAILGLLLVTIGLPFLVLSSTGPLLQSWYARCLPGTSPYRLYALSNLGSLLGLLSYPFVLEPLWPVTTQGWGWTAGFFVFASGCAAAAVLVGRTADAAAKAPADHADHADGADHADHADHADPESSRPPTPAAKALWVLLAMTASVLLLAITSQISLEVAVIPFLWMLPLALYLLSFVLCFEYEGVYHRAVWIPLLLVGAGCTTAVLYLGVDAPMLVQLVVYLTTLLLACMVCHGELVRRKPVPRYLTGFYLWVSAGGAAGGVFTGVVAPAVFPDLWELPMALVIACGLAITLGLSEPSIRRRIRFRVAAGLGALYVGAVAVALVMHAADELDDNLYVTRGFFGV
ncbi:MAG: ferrichrome ABC transporter permease, partial [Myxococcales bacterium]|nr:ferrichrome ABC transporter permease [Myxococcales bacterium]